MLSAPIACAKRRRKALAWWMMAVVIWAVFAYKESKHEPSLPMADSSTKPIIMQHIFNQSEEVFLYGRENVCE